MNHPTLLPRYYALLGCGIAYSRSPEIHRALWAERGEQGDYRLYDTPDLPGFVSMVRHTPALGGFNVTIPYKQSIIPHLDALAQSASSVGAVNTVCCDWSSGRCYLVGHNTDTDGFAALLGDTHLPAFILGTGGASRAVRYVLQQHNLPHFIVSRRADRAHYTYQTVGDSPYFHAPKVLINATPLGSAHHPGAYPPLPYHLVTEADLLIDLVYTPDPTPFMEQGAQRGARTLSGLTMLIEQAAAAQRLWREIAIKNVPLHKM